MISAKDFFKLLNEKGLKKSVALHDNLMSNFALHEKIKENLVVGKLEKHLGNINTNEKLKKIGMMVGQYI